MLHYGLCSRPNGCELSGRGSLPHRTFQEPASPLFLASAAASPVRSSELLGDLAVQSQEIGNTLFSRHILTPDANPHFPIILPLQSQP